MRPAGGTRSRILWSAAPALIGCKHQQQLDKSGGPMTAGYPPSELAMGGWPRQRQNKISNAYTQLIHADRDSSQPTGHTSCLHSSLRHLLYVTLGFPNAFALGQALQSCIFATEAWAPVSFNHYHLLFFSSRRITEKNNKSEGHRKNTPHRFFLRAVHHCTRGLR